MEICVVVARRVESHAKWCQTIVCYAFSIRFLFDLFTFLHTYVRMYTHKPKNIGINNNSDVFLFFSFETLLHTHTHRLISSHHLIMQMRLSYDWMTRFYLSFILFYGMICIDRGIWCRTIIIIVKVIKIFSFFFFFQWMNNLSKKEAESSWSWNTNEKKVKEQKNI